MKRTAYHRAYYAAHAERRRQQKRLSLVRLGGKAYRHLREMILEDVKRESSHGR